MPAAFEAPTDVTQAGVPLDHWWTVYNDPQLEGLVDEALVDAPDARTARARLEEAVRGALGSALRLQPAGRPQARPRRPTADDSARRRSINLGPLGSILAHQQPARPNQELLNFDVSWEIDLFGRRAATRRKANADLAAARFDYEATPHQPGGQRRRLAVPGPRPGDPARRRPRDRPHRARAGRHRPQQGRSWPGRRSPTPTRPRRRPPSPTPRSPTWRASCTPRAAPCWCWSARASIRWRACRRRAEAGAPPPVPASVPGELLARRPDVREAAAKLRSATGQLKLDELALFPKFTLTPGVGLTSSDHDLACGHQRRLVDRRRPRPADPRHAAAEGRDPRPGRARRPGGRSPTRRPCRPPMANPRTRWWSCPSDEARVGAPDRGRGPGALRPTMRRASATPPASTI